MARFFIKKTHTVGGMEVATGVRGSVVKMRVSVPQIPGGMYFTVDEAEDLADALDKALSEQEDNPVPGTPPTGQHPVHLTVAADLIGEFDG